jgi:hypothetical protein
LSCAARLKTLRMPLASMEWRRLESFMEGIPLRKG